MCKILSLFLRKRFRWSQRHDELLLREVIKIELWTTKPGTPERGANWKAIADALNAVEHPTFSVNQRSARDRFQHIVEKHKTKEREQKQVNGKAPVTTENDELLDDIIKLFEIPCTKDSVDVMSLGVEEENSMNKFSLRSNGESAKRKIFEDEKDGKRTWNANADTFEIMDGIFTVDSEWRRKENFLRKLELKEQVRRSEGEEAARRSGEDSQERDVLIQLESVKRQLQQQNEILLQICEKQQQQNDLIMNLVQNLTDRN